MTDHEGLTLIRRMVMAYGLARLGWTVEINNRLRTSYAHCDRVRKRIEVMPEFLRVNGPKEVEEVGLHEVAHALTTGGHTSAWKTMHMLIGGTGQTYPDVVVPEKMKDWVRKRKGEEKGEEREVEAHVECTA